MCGEGQYVRDLSLPKTKVLPDFLLLISLHEGLSHARPFLTSVSDNLCLDHQQPHWFKGDGDLQNLLWTQTSYQPPENSSV